jgi:ketol-acid reductoisomerase
MRFYSAEWLKLQSQCVSLTTYSVELVMKRETIQETLRGSSIGLIGYGAQGSAEATNLRRSGISFKLGLRPDGPSAERAAKDHFEVYPIKEVIAQSDTIIINLPDQEQARFFQEHLQERQNIKRLVFAHGFNTHFGLIPVLPNGPQHILVAPKGAASGLLEFYETPHALPCILSIQSKREISEENRKWAETYALAIGCHPRALFWANFKDETECDLFSEQALLCGGVSSLLRASYDLLIENGYHPETAYFETLYELKIIVDLIWKAGISGMREKISPTARFGDVTRGDRVIDSHVKANMQKILEEIQSGDFAKEFLKNSTSTGYHEAARTQSQHPIEVLGKKLRDRMR